MTIELNRSVFRRLVQLQIVSFVVSIALTLRTLIAPTWLAFDGDFTVLADRHFGLSGFEEPIGLVLTGAVLSWSLASMVGLFWFKRWARFGFWASIIVLCAAILVLEGERPLYLAPLDSFAMSVNTALSGAILLLAYARGHGAEWFAPAAGVEN